MKIGLFEEKIFSICDYSDLIKCLKQIKSQRLLLMRAPISELPTNIGTVATNTFWIRHYTICPRSSGPFHIVAYYIKWVTTSWTYSIKLMSGTDGQKYKLVIPDLAAVVSRGVHRGAGRPFVHLPLALFFFYYSFAPFI